MKIIGFLQVRNELSSGHISRFMKVNAELFDALYVFDDHSDDGTYEYLTEHADFVVRGGTRMFGSELVNKAELLDKVKADFDPGDAILWLDADEVIYASRQELVDIISGAFSEGYDSLSLPHINLWRSNNWFRVDDNYDSLEAVRIWKLSDKLFFPREPGLHGQMYPNGISRIKRVNYAAVVHFGFASTDYILDKYVTYRSHWQSGYALHRLISEFGRELQPLKCRTEMLGSRFSHAHNYVDVDEPVILTQHDWLKLANSRYEEYLRNVMPRVTLVSLIYASTKWLEFAYSQLLELKRDLPEGEAEILFIANDANKEVLNFLKDNAIPHLAVTTKKFPDEWFINSVYRAYNLGVLSSKTDYVYLVNSDMAFSRGALSSIMRNASPDKLLASRLVELGVMPSGKYGIEKDFGSSPNKYRKNDFESFARKISRDELSTGGLFMPLLVHKEKFLELGGYPEGNLTEESLNDYVAGGPGEIANIGQRLVPGDAAFIARASSIKIEHLTLMSSVAYHFQAGERRDEGSPRSIRSGVAILNDSLVGINGEIVLWGKLQSLLENAGLLVRGVPTGISRSRIAKLYAPLTQSIKGQILLRRGRMPRVLVTNATYQFPLVGSWRKILVLQDQPPGIIMRSLQKISLLNSERFVTNDAELVGANRGKKSDWATIPLSEIWWDEPSNELKSHRKVIFVGAYNETKGWFRVKDLIENDQSLSWILVSKYDEKPEISIDAARRVEAFSRLSAVELRELMRQASALVVASPYETQCLVALEAASQRVPIVTTPTGTLGSFGEGLKDFGVVTNDLKSGIDEVLNGENHFDPRRFVKDLNIISETGWQIWQNIVSRELEESFRLTTEQAYVLRFMHRLKSYAIGLIRRFMRTALIPLLVRIKRKIT
jgi:glycosyltransferase involved in cell wall biosynthesis